MSTDFRITRSFRFAFSGVKEALKSEPNLKIHLLLAFLALLFACFLGFSSVEWTILLLTIALVLILELINTSLEAITDLVSPEIKEKAKVAKDVAASAVLISALTSLLVGVFLFLPKILRLLVP